MPSRLHSGKSNSKNRKPLIAHAWTDYVPSSFVEAHTSLIEGGDYRSMNLVANLWDNGKIVDEHTIALRDLNSHHLVSPSILRRAIARIERPWLHSRFACLCERSVKRLDVSLVHSHFGTTGCEIAPLLDQMGIPHVVTIYGYDGSAVLRNPSYVEKYRRMFKVVDRIIVLSDVVKQRLVGLGCDPGLIVTWNMPAGVERFTYRAKARRETIRILMAGRFAEAKGHVYLLEAMRKLLRKNYPVRLTLVGYGNLVPQLEKKISSLGLRPYVSLINNKLCGDFSSDFGALLKEADLYVAPSITDRHGTDEAGPSLTAVCAQAAGVPVVSTPFPGSEVSVMDGHTGLLCREADPDSLAEQMERLILDPRFAAQLGRNGSLLVQREFSRKTQMKKLISLYDEALGIEPQAAAAATTPGNTLVFPVASARRELGL